jgi:hypothetical protein
MDHRPTTEHFDLAYPAPLREREDQLTALRRRGAGVSPDAPKVGFALSGGGIRSATFCLGVFQALSRLKLLGRIDYLSTVSGGGYFGSCLGRLFTRSHIRNVADAEAALLGETPPDAPEPSPTRPEPPKVFRWLRDNGRYLSPRGAGDLLLGVGIVLRNWIAVQVVLTSLVLVVFLTAQLVRAAAEVLFPAAMGGLNEALTCYLPGGGWLLWWSPYTALAGLVAALWVVPVGWAYWLLVPQAPGLRYNLDPRIGLAAGVVLGALGMALVAADHPILGAFSFELVLGGVLAFAWSLAARRRARSRQSQQMPALAAGDRALFEDSEARHWISSQLKRAMVWTGALLAFSLVDTLGQTGYAAAVAPDAGLGAWSSAVFGILAAAAAFARQVVVLFGGRGTSKRPRLPLSLIATATALLVMVLVLGTLNAFSHGLAWDFAEPAARPSGLGKAEAPQLLAAKSLVVMPSPTGEGWTASTRAAAEGGNRCPVSTPTATRSRPADLVPPLAAWAVALLVSLLFGRSWPFLNGSSLHPLYSARLIRAYLGASNPRRGDAGGSVTQVMPGDDIGQRDYWQPPKGEPSAAEKGAPAHLVNVTINETIDGISQLEQQDRKGLGMALGPAGISVGVRHHVLWRGWEPPGVGSEAAAVFPAPERPGMPAGRAFRVFEYPKDAFRGEPLSLGQWAGISGAAFSTGVGARTNLGLSLLAGFGNIRLGYWWNSGVDLGRRPGERSVTWPRTASRWVREAFRVQFFFLQEFLARFPGTARHHWYLSDGGHFENMGAYELIRRRLPVVVVIDAEADPEYTFEGLSDLVRKARLDFQAEIRFLSEAELDQAIDPELRPDFGPLQHLRRGRWEQKEASLPETPGQRRPVWVLPEPEASGWSLAHAALAEIRYQEQEEPAWLLYLKPTLTGDEPADIVQYHSAHPAFPQESTSDQFFDEAQWESYRKLGEWIAQRVFARAEAGEPKRFVPGLFGLRPSAAARARAPARKRRPAAPRRPAAK